MEDWSDEVAKDDWREYILGLTVITDHNLALPGLRHLTSLGRVCTEFNHDTHLRIKNHSLRNHCKDELLVLIFITLCGSGLNLTSGSLVLPGCCIICLLLSILLYRLDLAYPSYFHLLTASVLKEILLRDDLVGVLSSKINVLYFL
jgi:hypothetical protein